VLLVQECVELHAMLARLTRPPDEADLLPLVRLLRCQFGRARACCSALAAGPGLMPDATVRPPSVCPHRTRAWAGWATTSCAKTTHWWWPCTRRWAGAGLGC